MSKEFVFIFMIFMHILDDFCLQSFFLANGKQKDWWKAVEPNPKYQDDYLVCLLMHGFSWSFCLMLPIAIYYHFNINIWFLIGFFANAVIHAFIDNIKSNIKRTNLVQDQTAHMFQLIITYASFMYSWKDLI